MFTKLAPGAKGMEEVRGRVNEVRRKAKGKGQNTFIVADQRETSAGQGHLH